MLHQPTAHPAVFLGSHCQRAAGELPECTIGQNGAESPFPKWATCCTRVRCRYENDRRDGFPGNWPLAEQSRREFSPAVSTTRTGNTGLSEYAKFAEIRFRPFCSSQPTQPGAPPLPSRHFQDQPHRHSRRVAPTWCGIRASRTVLTETGSHRSDSATKRDCRTESYASLSLNVPFSSIFPF